MKSQKLVFVVMGLLLIGFTHGVLSEQLRSSNTPDGVISLWDGKAPGSESATHREQQTKLPGGNEVFTRNVVEPTLSVYLPAPETATGTGIVIAPGGGFRMLSMENEGHALARWLRDRGIAAFVLKYRLVETPRDDILFYQALKAAGERISRGDVAATLDEEGKLGIVDGLRAMELVFKNADRWEIDKTRIGILGFSAGASVAGHAALSVPPEYQPRFVASIYGAPFSEYPKIDASMPPVFLAHSSNDAPFLLKSINAFYIALRRAGHHPERHIYRDGGHGYGMKKQGTSSDHWIDDFYNWLGSLGFTGESVMATTLNGNRIRHTVAFRLKHASESEQEREFLSALEKLAAITGVDSFEILRQVGQKNHFTFGASMEFANQKAYDSYNSHPDHVRFVNERWMKEVDDFMEIDYQPRQ